MLTNICWIKEWRIHQLGPGRSFKPEPKLGDMTAGFLIFKIREASAFRTWPLLNPLQGAGGVCLFCPEEWAKNHLLMCRETKENFLYQNYILDLRSSETLYKMAFFPHTPGERVLNFTQIFNVVWFLREEGSLLQRLFKYGSAFLKMRDPFDTVTR